MTSNPLDDLRQINREQRSIPDPSANADLRPPVSTVSRKSARTGGRKSAPKPVRKEGSAAVLTDAIPAVLPDASTAVSPPVQPDAPPDVREAVRNTVGQRRIYQGGVKATIDLAPELSTRFKRYSIDHSNVTLRQILTELLEAYLEGEGY